jgi:hypothetical protein
LQKTTAKAKHSGGFIRFENQAVPQEETIHSSFTEGACHFTGLVAIPGPGVKRRLLNRGLESSSMSVLAEEILFRPEGDNCRGKRLLGGRLLMLNLHRGLNEKKTAIFKAYPLF